MRFTHCPRMAQGAVHESLCCLGFKGEDVDCPGVGMPFMEWLVIMSFMNLAWNQRLFVSFEACALDLVGSATFGTGTDTCIKRACTSLVGNARLSLRTHFQKSLSQSVPIESNQVDRQQRCSLCLERCKNR